MTFIRGVHGFEIPSFSRDPDFNERKYWEHNGNHVNMPKNQSHKKLMMMKNNRKFDRFIL